MTAILKEYVRQLPFAHRPVTIQSVETPPNTINHSYRDFSKVPPPPGHRVKTNLDEMTFAEKVYDILSQPRFEHSISWRPHGRAFCINVPKSFESEVCPQYFGHSRYSSFLRDLNKFGFKHISKGEDRNCYYHELMLKGCPHLAQFMPRCKDARRLDADPPNEPDFYSINVLFPLKEQSPGGIALPLGAMAPKSSTTPSSVTRQWEEKFYGNNRPAAKTPVSASPSPLPFVQPQQQQPQALPAAVAPTAALPNPILAALNSLLQQQQQQQQQQVLPFPGLSPFSGMPPGQQSILLGNVLQQAQGTSPPLSLPPAPFPATIQVTTPPATTDNSALSALLASLTQQPTSASPPSQLTPEGIRGLLFGTPGHSQVSTSPSLESIATTASARTENSFPIGAMFPSVTGNNNNKTSSGDNQWTANLTSMHFSQGQQPDSDLQRLLSAFVQRQQEQSQAQALASLLSQIVAKDGGSGSV